MTNAFHLRLRPRHGAGEGLKLRPRLTPRKRTHHEGVRVIADRDQPLGEFRLHLRLHYEVRGQTAPRGAMPGTTCQPSVLSSSLLVARARIRGASMTFERPEDLAICSIIAAKSTFSF